MGSGLFDHSNVRDPLVVITVDAALRMSEIRAAQRGAVGTSDYEYKYMLWKGEK